MPPPSVEGYALEIRRPGRFITEFRNTSSKRHFRTFFPTTLSTARRWASAHQWPIGCAGILATRPRRSCSDQACSRRGTWIVNTLPRDSKNIAKVAVTMPYIFGSSSTWQPGMIIGLAAGERKYLGRPTLEIP